MSEMDLDLEESKYEEMDIPDNAPDDEETNKSPVISFG